MPGSRAAIGTFSPDVLYGTGDSPYSVAIGGLDGDGAADLVVANGFSDNVSVLLNQCASSAGPPMPASCDSRRGLRP